MIFEDDEKDNNEEFDASISSDDTEGISWDDLIDESEANISAEVSEAPIELNADDIQIKSSEMVDGLEGIGESPSSETNEVSEDDLENFVNLDILEDQDSTPIVEESSASIATNNDLGEVEIQNNQTEVEYNTSAPSEVHVESSKVEIPLDSANIEEDSYETDNRNLGSDNSQIIGIASLNRGQEEEINEEVYNIAPPQTPQRREKSSGNGAVFAVLGLIAAIIVVGAIAGFFIIGQKGDFLKTIFNTGGNGEEISTETMDMGFDENNLNPNEMSEAPQEQSEAVAPPQEQSVSSNPAPVAENPQTPPKKEEKIVVSVTKGGRANPFSPVGNISAAGYTVPTLGNLAPPSELTEDEELGKLVDIVCTGILYDNVKPSAIITVGGVDYFVQKGDRVDKFIVSAITPTSVVIRNGSNSYVATIGQEFDIGGSTPGKMNYVYNGKSKPVTRQYLSPQEIEVKVK